MAREFQICYVEREPDKKTGKKHKDISLSKFMACVILFLTVLFKHAKLVIIDEAEFMNNEASTRL